MINTSLTPESDIETWTAVFFSSLEPREDFKELLSKMIDLMRSILREQKFPEEFMKYFLNETLPGAIKRIIHFQSITYSLAKDKVVSFFREAVKFINYSLHNNLENLYSPLISMLDPESIIYQKNTNYGDPFYSFIYKDYFNSNEAKATSIYFFDNYDAKITQYNFIFKIYSNNLKGKMKKNVLILASTIMVPYVEYINSIEDLHDTNTRALQDSLISFIELTVDKTNIQLYIKLFNFLKKCLKSDMIEKQAIAAKTISNFCNIRNDILILLQNSTIKENIENFLDEATNPELNITVVNLFIPFFETLCNPKVSLIHFEHICKLYDIASASTDSEQQSPLFSFIANSIDGFEEEIQFNICDYITRPQNTTSTYKFLTKLTKTFWKNHQDKALGYVSLVLGETERDQSARDAIISIYKQNIIPVEARILLVKEMLKKISYNEDSAEFAQTVLCSMIDTSNSLREIFTKGINDEIIQQMTKNNRKYIFKIITKLFSKSSIYLKKENIQFFLSFGNDDELWSFYKDIFDTNKMYHSDEIFDLIVEQAQIQSLSDQITKAFIQFLISFIGFENKSLFNSWKRKNSTTDGSPKYIDIIFQAFVSSNDLEATKISEDYLLQIFTTMKPMREILFSFIESHLDDEKFLMNYNALNIILNFIEISEDSIDPEDFEYQRHKYPSNLIILKCSKHEVFQFLIHIKPGSTLSNLLHRIAIRNKCTKATSTKFMKPSDEKKTLFELGIKNYDDFAFGINYDTYEYEMPFSVLLMKSGFVRKLLSISNDNSDEKFLDLIQKLLDILPTDEQIYLNEFKQMDVFVNKLKDESIPEIEKKYYLQSLLSLIREEKDQEKDQQKDQEKESNELSSQFAKNGGIDTVVFNLLMRYNESFYFEFLNELFYKNEESFAPIIGIIISRFLDSIIENWTNSFAFLLFKQCMSSFQKETLEYFDQYQDKLYQSFDKVTKKFWNYYVNFLELESDELFRISYKHIHQDQKNLPFYIKLLSKTIKKIIKDYKDHKNTKIAADIYDSNFINNCCSMLEWNEVKPAIGELVEIIFLITNSFASKNKELKQITKDHEELLTSIVFDTSNPKTQMKLIDIIKLSYSEKTEQYLEKLFSNNKDIEDHWNYSPDLFKRESPYMGLRNLGATCFFNSIIQQLYHLFPVQYLLATYKFEKDSELIPLQSLFLEMHYSERKFCDTEPFIKQWQGWQNRLINPREQHDAVEFFGYLIDALPKCITELFTGKLINIITRKNGDLFHSDSVPFINLSVSIKGMNNLEESLSNFIVAEELQKQDDSTNKKITVLKSVRVEEAPPILVISLERFEYLMKTYEKKKLNDRFTFQDNLNIDKISQNPTNTNYKLVGIVVHSGTAIGGHYISFVKKNANKIDSQWWKFNDIEVSEVSKEDVESASFGSASQQISAYVLFYIKEDFILNVSEEEDNESTVTFFKELDYTDKVNIDFILKDNLDFKHTQSIFSEPIIEFVLCIKENALLQLNFFINVLCHSQFEKKSKEFSEQLIKNIDKYKKNKECLLYLFNKVHLIYKNLLYISYDEMIDGLCDVIVCCSKEDISICIPFLDLLKQNVYSFRQTPKIYEAIYKMIKNVIDKYYSSKKTLNIIKIYQDLNEGKIDDTFLFIFRKISEIITFAYTESRPQLFSNLNFTHLFNIIQELIGKIGIDDIDLSTICDFRSMISKSSLHYSAFNKMMNAYDNEKRKKKSGASSSGTSYFDMKSLHKPSTIQTISNTTTIFPNNNKKTKDPTYSSPNRNTINKPKQPTLVLTKEPPSTSKSSVKEDKEIEEILKYLTRGQNNEFLESLKSFVNEKPLSFLNSFYECLYKDIVANNHYQLKINFIKNSPKYFANFFIKSEIEQRKATLFFYNRIFKIFDETNKRELISNFNEFIKNNFQEYINFAYIKVSQKITSENSYLYQFLEYYKYLVIEGKVYQRFTKSNAKTIFDTIQLIHKKGINNDVNMKILLEILGSFDCSLTNDLFEDACNIILNSNSTIYMSVFPLFFNRERELKSLEIMNSDAFAKYTLLCWQMEQYQDITKWQSEIKEWCPSSKSIFNRIFSEYKSEKKSTEKMKLKDVLVILRNTKNKDQISPEELGNYVTIFFETVQGKNPSNDDVTQFDSLFNKNQKEVGKFNFDPQRVEQLITNPSYPKRGEISNILKNLLKVSSNENDDLLLKLVDNQIKDKFKEIQPSYFADLIPFLHSRNECERIKSIAEVLCKENNQCCLSKIYEYIKNSIDDEDSHSKSFDNEWIGDMFLKSNPMIIRKNKDFYHDVISKFNDQQIINLFQKLQNCENFCAISTLVWILDDQKKTDLIIKLKNCSHFSSLPPDRKWKTNPYENEKKFFKMIIKEIGVDDDDDD